MPRRHHLGPGGTFPPGTRSGDPELHERHLGVIGPNLDILAPDVNTDAKVMGWVMDAYSSRAGWSPAVVTGKPLDLAGIPGRVEATGRGVVAVTAATLRVSARAWPDSESLFRVSATWDVTSRRSQPSRGQRSSVSQMSRAVATCHTALTSRTC